MIKINTLKKKKNLENKQQTIERIYPKGTVSADMFFTLTQLGGCSKSIISSLSFMCNVTNYDFYSRYVVATIDNHCGDAVRYEFSCAHGEDCAKHAFTRRFIDGTWTTVG